MLGKRAAANKNDQFAEEQAENCLKLISRLKVIIEDD